MNLAALSLENAPRFWVPLRFFLTAPLFGILAAVMLLLDGGSLLQSRWQAATLALIHALTLGYLSMAMLGALLQMLPVVMGAALPRVERLVGITHLTLTAGTLCLIAAFLTGTAELFVLAMLLLVPVLMVFALVLLSAIWRTGAARTTARVTQMAAFSLLCTVALGAWLASGYAFETLQFERSLTDYHVAWGIIGWIFMLVLGVSAQVIPMFLTTPSYPKGFTKGMAYLLMLLLVAGSLLPFAGVTRVAVILVAVLMMVYALVTLYLLSRRRRKRFDITDWFWRLGMLCLIGGAAALLVEKSGGGLMNRDIAVLSGMLLLVGFAVSLINGMLYKIVPFLVWLNLRMPVLRGRVPAGTRLYTPNIHEIIAARFMRTQFLLHVGSLLLLMAAWFWQGLWINLSAVVLMMSNLLLLINLLQAVQLFRKYSGQVAGPAGSD